MRKLFDELFYIPKHGKIREKVMLTRVVMTISIIVMCLAAMCITAYAYFSYNVTSGSNIIKAANFGTKVSITITDTDVTAVEAVTTNTSDYKTHNAELKANKTYSVTLQHTELSTAQTGFVIITAKDCDIRYHTQQLSRAGAVTFFITPGADTVVTFLSHWGTSSFYHDFMEIGENDERYIIAGEEIKMVVNGAAPKEEITNPENTIDQSVETPTTPPTDMMTGADSSSTQASEDTITPPAEITNPADTITPETPQASEQTDTTEPSATITDPTTTLPTTENTEITDTPTIEANE